MFEHGPRGIRPAGAVGWNTLNLVGTTAGCCSLEEVFHLQTDFIQLTRCSSNPIIIILIITTNLLEDQGVALSLNIQHSVQIKSLRIMKSVCLYIQSNKINLSGNDTTFQFSGGAEVSVGQCF